MKFETTTFSGCRNKIVLIFGYDEYYKTAKGETKIEEIESFFNSAFSCLEKMKSDKGLNEKDYSYTKEYLERYLNCFRYVSEIGKEIREKGVSNVSVSKEIDYSAQCELSKYIHEIA